MDFFAKQESAHRQTGRLLILFVLSVLLTIVGVHLIVTGVLLLGQWVEHSYLDLPEAGLIARVLRHGMVLDPGLIVVDAATALLVILCALGITHSRLSASGRAAAEACGGRLLDPATHGLEERRLLHVVEEMAIASGVPVPPVYVLDREKGLNAFVAGKATSDACLAVTRGALEQFTRDELQGVIGHEFSHLLNGDMRLNLKLAGWLGGIMGLALVGEMLLHSLWELLASSDKLKRRARPKGEKWWKYSNRSYEGRGSLDGVVACLYWGLLFPPLLLLALASLLLGCGLYFLGQIGVFFGRLIQAAVSRQREFLADASAVQFTRYPSGLAQALMRIADSTAGSTIRKPQALMLRHMFFSNAAKPSWLDLALATHPPIEQRIRWLDPTIHPNMASLTLPAPAVEPEPELEVEEPPLLGLVDGKRTGRRPPRRRATRRVPLEQAEGFVAALPEPLLTATRNAPGACAVVCALLLSEQLDLREQQLQRLRKLAGESAFHHLERLLPLVESLPCAHKLPVAGLALSGLRTMDRSQFAEFQTALDYLIASDGFLDLFEFTLQKVLRHHLDILYGVIPVVKVRYRRLAPLRAECRVILSCLARQGQPHDAAGAKAAYQSGLRQLGLEGASDEPLPQDECKLDAVDAALDKLNTASFPLKKTMLAACAAAAAADGQESVEEAELLRAISEALDCPVPPTLPTSAGG